MVTLTVHQTYTAQSFRLPPYYLISDNLSDRASLLSDRHAIWPGKCPMTDCYTVWLEILAWNYIWRLAK